jgi:hypothetical protein
MSDREAGMPTGPWPPEKARLWWAEQPWRVGCNFIPSSAINQIEMWQASTYDERTISRELQWAAELGFNLIRVYLHDLVWEDDASGLLARIERFLEIAAEQRIAVIFVLFDDVWSSEFKLGKQPEPHPGRHNSGWVQSPGLEALRAYPDDPAIRLRLKQYVQGILSHFRQDERILVWDVYNEPGGFPSPLSEPVAALSTPLLLDTFEWARATRPLQPLTSGIWQNPVEAVAANIERIQLENSDVLSFHHYGKADELEATCDRLAGLTERPLLCTEYLARPLKSLFETHLPIFRERKIAAVHWGLVSGKTQTIYPWWSWFEDFSPDEPEIWFHDVLRADGTPFDPREIRFLREILGV